ncbi:hypothetical protein PIB30_058635, partial [Stylosanthes scabra]|nr:hypothetical protein [Stylosanthes scabra]
LWWIWRYRNNTIFNRADQWPPEKVIALVLFSERELHRTISMTQSPAFNPVNLNWHPPAPDSIKRQRRVQIVLIQRTANRVADALAKFAVCNGIHHVDWLQPSDDLKVLLQHDINSLV